MENYSYPEWRTEGTDRVLIFDDTDGDGRFDTRKVFLDGGRNLTGIEIGRGGVWLTSPPELVFVADRDRDDRPDGPPEVILDGFNADRVAHNVVNGLKWGPDGWLYGRHGIQAKSLVGRPGTPAAERVVIDCGIWRIHPDSKKFEVVARGTTNPWGLDYDDFGEMVFTNNVFGHLWHLIPGAHYERMPRDLHAAGDADLVALQFHDNDWVCRQARRILADRAAAGGDLSHAATDLRRLAETHADPTRRLRGLWGAHAVKAAD